MKKFVNYFKKEFYYQVAIACVAGVLCLLLTLTIAEYNSRKEKKKIVHKMALSTLFNIDQSIHALESIYNYVSTIDSLSKEVDTAIKADSLKEDLCCTLIYHCVNDILFSIDDAPETTFNSNFEVWQYFDNITVMHRIGQCYSYKNTAMKLYYELRTKLLDIIYDEINNSKETQDDTCKDIVERLYKRNDFDNLMLLLNRYKIIFKACSELTYIENEKNKRDMNITDKEFEILRKGILNPNDILDKYRKE